MSKKKYPRKKNNNKIHPNQSTSCHRAVGSAIYAPQVRCPVGTQGRKRQAPFLLPDKCAQAARARAERRPPPQRRVLAHGHFGQTTGNLVAQKWQPELQRAASPGISGPPKVSVRTSLPPAPVQAEAPAPQREAAGPARKGRPAGARGGEGRGRDTPWLPRPGGRGGARVASPGWGARAGRYRTAWGRHSPARTSAASAPPLLSSAAGAAQPHLPTRGSRSGGRLPPSPPASPSARLRAPPLPAGPRGQLLSAAPLPPPPPPPGRAPPGLARAPDARERAGSCARSLPPPSPPRTRSGPAPRPWPRRQVLPPEGPAAGSPRVALVWRASAAVCVSGARTGREPLWHKGDAGVLEPAPAPPSHPWLGGGLGGGMGFLPEAHPESMAHTRPTKGPLARFRARGLGRDPEAG